MKTALFIYTETSLHAGTGTGLGAVDLPIQREKHTDYPIIQASGVKGALRDTTELSLGDNEATIKAIFGGASGQRGEDHAGAISPSDARILLFPVRALNGVFVWITSPTVLSRFANDIGGTDLAIPKLEDATALVSSAKLLVGERIMLEEYAYEAAEDAETKAWAAHLAKHALPDNYDYWKTRLATHLVILPDDEFRDFVKYATDIVTRIHLDDTTKTVQQGQLFTQELLPADSLLYSMVIVTKTRFKRENEQGEVNKQWMDENEVYQKLRENLSGSIQIGADETVGRGRVRLKWME